MPCIYERINTNVVYPVRVCCCFNGGWVLVWKEGKEMIEFKVKNCQECPFCNNDNEYGRDSCNHPFNFEKAVREGYPYKLWSEMPKDKVHDNCPLKEEPLTVTL